MNTVDTSALKARYRDALDEVASRAKSLWLTYARDSRKLSRLQTGIIALLVFWSISSVSQLIWIPFRTSAIETAPAAAINPPRSVAQNPAQSVDVSKVLGSGLFGAGPDLPLEAAENGVAASGQRDGIEQNAKETRLAGQTNIRTPAPLLSNLGFSFRPWGKIYSPLQNLNATGGTHALTATCRNVRNIDPLSNIEKRCVRLDPRA